MSEYIITCDDEVAMWVGNDVESMKEIVRCRDCRYYKPKEGAMLSCKFEYHGFTQWKLAEPDGYCAWGERREQ